MKVHIDNASLSGSLGDQGLLRSANTLQIADVVRRVVFLLFLRFFKTMFRRETSKMLRDSSAILF